MTATRDPCGLDATTAERLLSRRPVAGHDHLVRLLAALDAPAREGEFSGRAAALAALRTAVLAPITPPGRRPSAVRAGLGRLLTVKTAALCLAIGSTGGVAVAAGTGSFPEPIQRHVPGFSRQHHPHAGASSRPSTQPGQPTPPYALLALCDQYGQVDPAGRGTALRSEARFADLVARIGGPDPAKADEFCGDLRRAWPDASPSGQPGSRPQLPPGVSPGPTGAGPVPMPAERPPGVPVGPQPAATPPEAPAGPLPGTPAGPPPGDRPPPSPG